MPVGLLGLSADQYKQERRSPHLDKQNTQRVALEGEETVHLRRSKLSSLILWVLHCTWLKSISRKFCWVFFPMRVSQDKYLCSLFPCCACYSFNYPFCFGITTFKTLTLYQSQHERRHCVQLFLQFNKIGLTIIDTSPHRLARKGLVKSPSKGGSFC